MVPGAMAVPPPTDPGARRSLRARFAAGPLGVRIAAFDLRFYRLLRVPADSEAPLKAFSRCGEHAACWLALGTAGALADPPRRSLWRRATVGVVVTYLMNVAIKNVVRRKRPLLDDLPQLISTPTKLSFPSAHASSSFAAARGFSALLPAGPLYATAAAMALSRVALGVHYPSDIVAGAALGTAIGSAAR